jgi:hypothetical protein
MLLFFTMVSVCLGQTSSIIVALKDGTVKTYNLWEIREIRLSGVLTDVKQEQLAQSIIRSFTLYQNYPNPFNPSTNIKYEIPQAGLVDINIFDIQGRLIRSLGSTVQPAGSHSVTWDGRNSSGAMASSGTYFCRVRFKDNFLTNKLLLIK